MSELINGLRERLGLSDTADDAAALAAVDRLSQEVEALKEPVQPPPTTNTVPDGHVLLPQVAVDEMREQAALGAAAHEQLRVQNRAAALNGLRDRFLPANREAWETAYDQNPTNTVALLQGMPVVVPTTELGLGTQPSNEVDDLYAAIYGTDA